jgi:predicted site-specific integrase-resolvase
VSRKRGNGHGPKRAVLWAILYARVSTDEQACSGYSLVAQQIEALRAYAAREGYEILEEVQETPARAVQALSDQAWTV